MRRSVQIPKAVLLAAAFALLSACAAAGGYQGTASQIPARARAELLSRARKWGAVNGDRKPFDIEVVRTTHGRAGRLRGERVEPPPPSVQVYLVAMRGHFVCYECHGLGPEPRGTVSMLEFEVAAIDRRREGSLGGSLAGRYPKLSTVGKPVRLG